MATYTSSLPKNLLAKLSKEANKLKVPKNKIIEKALEIYLEQLKRERYIMSIKKASRDVEIMDMAEEGMSDYLKQLEDLDIK